MAKRPKVGDVYEIETPAGLAYIQFTHERPGMGELVRVLPGLYVARPEIAKLAQEKELYFAFYILDYAVRQGQAQLVSNEPVPEWAKLFPIMRHEGIFDKTWYIGSGAIEFSPRQFSKFLKVTTLTPQQKKLSISSYLYPHPAFVKEPSRGWTPERAEELEIQSCTRTELRPRQPLWTVEKTQHQMLETPMVLLQDQRVSPSGKKDIFLILRLKLRKKGQEIFLFGNEVHLPVNDHSGDGNPKRVQD